MGRVGESGWSVESGDPAPNRGPRQRGSIRQTLARWILAHLLARDRPGDSPETSMDACAIEEVEDGGEDERHHCPVVGVDLLVLGVEPVLLEPVGQQPTGVQ